MADGLNAGRRAAASGTTKSVVVFLHGYGADGNDLLGLAEPLAPHMPDTVFLAPDAPERCVGNPFGYQWFPFPWLDGSDPVAAGASMSRSVGLLNTWLDGVLADEGVGANNLALVGFSQGTMMALHLAPRRSEPVAAVVGFSGRLLEPERLAADVVVRPPILLIHGDRDPVVPPSSLPEAEKALTAAGFAVRTHVSEGMEHGIAPDGLGLAVEFLRQHLS